MGVMVLRNSKFGPFYGCNQYPRCTATHGAHPDGRPLGAPGDPETKKARIEAHSVFDAFWKEKKWNRGKAYSWMAKAMNLVPGTAHIGMFDKKQCEALIWNCKNDHLVPNII